MKKITVGFFGLLVAFAATAPSAHATLLPLINGAGLVLTSGSNIAGLPGGSTQIASTIQSVQTQSSSPGANWSATFQTTVYSSAGGILDFVYQFKTDSLTSGGAPDEIELSTFNGAVSAG